MTRIFYEKINKTKKTRFKKISTQLKQLLVIYQPLNEIKSGLLLFQSIKYLDT